MTCVIFGKVLKIDGDRLEVLDSVSKEVHTNLYLKSKPEDLKVDQTWVFHGDCLKGAIKVDRLDLRKFLDPLYEEDLFASSGAYTLIHPINDPFPHIYKSMLDKIKEDSKSESN